MPPRLAGDNAIDMGDCVWIGEDTGRRFEGDSVFSLVYGVLVFVPREGYVYIQNCSTRCGGFGVLNTFGVSGRAPRVVANGSSQGRADRLGTSWLKMPVAACVSA